LKTLISPLNLNLSTICVHYFCGRATNINEKRFTHSAVKCGMSQSLHTALDIDAETNSMVAEL